MITSTYSKADALATEVTTFWASSVGGTINKLSEFSLLVEWHDAVSAALDKALTMRDWVSVDHYDKMMDECNMWLDHTA